MEEDRSSSVRPNVGVKAGIVGSLFPSSFISIALSISFGITPWLAIITITACGALGGYLGWLIVGKFVVKSKLFPVIIVAGIFGFFAGFIAVFIMGYL